VGIAGLVSIARFRATRSCIGGRRYGARVAFFLLASDCASRVQGNWPSFLYRQFAWPLVRLSESELQSWRGLRWSAQAAMPGSRCSWSPVIYAQAVFGIIP
jgi:hypothetical protein